MSMIGEYLRVTSAQLGQAVIDPEWALELAEAAQDAEEEAEPAPGQGRHFSTHQTWNLLAFLLQRVGFPVDVVFGEVEFTQEDWGYGPPKYLTAARVEQAAEMLARTGYDALLQGLDHAELTDAVYPGRWDSRESLEWARDSYGGIVEFFAAAARAGEAMLLWLD
jgi:hypothetical protein